MNRKTVFSYVCMLAGYSLFGIYAASLRFHFGFPVEFYWLSFVLVAIPLLGEVTLWNNPKLRILYLISFSLMIHLQYAAVDSSLLLSSEDAAADYRLADKIVADSQWIPFESIEWGFGFEYRFYPITNFLYATVSLLTGLPLLIVVKYLFVVKAFVATPLIERFFRIFFNQRVSYLATALFLASPGAILFPHKETFAVIFFFIGIYAATKIEKARQYLLIGFISILTLVMTHHFTTYIFLVLLCSLFLVSHFHKGQKAVRVSSQFLLLCLVVFVAWVAFIAWTIVAIHQKLLINMFFEFLLPGQVVFSELLPIYSLYERIIVWLGLGIAAVSAVLGFLNYVRDKKKFSFSFFAMTIFLVILLIVASIFRFAPHRQNILISHRAFEFGYIAVGAFSALFFMWAFRSRKRLSLNMIVICAIIIMIITGPIMGAMNPLSFGKVSNTISPRAISLNSWMSESNANDEYTVGDRVIFLILSIYGDSKVAKNPEFFTTQDFDLSKEERSDWLYVATYVYMTDFYGSNATKFVGSSYFNALYTNGLLNIYGIVDRTSS